MQADGHQVAQAHQGFARKRMGPRKRPLSSSGRQASCRLRVHHHDRRIEEHRGRGIAVAERGGVQQGLEAAADLPAHLRRAVKAVAVEVEAAHQHSAHGAVLRRQRHQRAFDFRHLRQPPAVFRTVCDADDVARLEVVGVDPDAPREAGVSGTA